MSAPTAKRRIFLDMHFPDWPHRQTCTAFDPDEIAGTMIKNNVGSVILYAKCQYGNFYYDTPAFHKHTGLGKVNLFFDVCRKLQSAGVEVIAYYSVVWDELTAAGHPDWLVRGPHGEIDNLGEFRWSTLCINSPYREVVFAQLEEISRLMRPDGFWIDMTIIGKDRCFCPHCAELFLAQTGAPLTAAAARDGALGHLFTRFRYDYIEAFYREAFARIRAILPGANIANNYWGYPYSSSSMGSRAVGALREADFVTGEAYTDWTGLSSPALFAKYLRGVAQGRPFEALIGRFCGTWDYSAKPAAQLAAEAYAIAAGGGTVTIDDEPYADGRLDQDLYRDIGRIFGEIKRREHLLCGRPVRFAAIYHSQLTKDYDAGEADFITSFVGAYRLLKELQCPTEVIFDEALTPDSLAGLKVILLPSVSVVQPAQWHLLRTWAEDGGLLLCGGSTGLYRVENGCPAPFYAPLADLGLRREGLSDYTLSYFTVQDDALADGLPARPVTVRGPYVKYTTAGASVCADITDPICETAGKVFFHNNLPAPYEPSAFPALTETRLGRGRAFVFAQDIFTQFGRYHQPEVKRLCGNILRKVGLPSPLAVSCASNVELSLDELDDGRLVLHLVNFTPGMTVCSGHMDTFEGRYPRTFEFMDEVNALCDVKITLRRPVRTAHAFALGAALPCERAGEVTVITLPRLDQWESLVLTPEP